MIQAAVTNIVRPTITPHDPYALSHEHIGQAEQISSFGGIVRLQALLQNGHPFALGFDAGFVVLFALQQFVYQAFAYLAGQPGQ